MRFAMFLATLSLALPGPARAADKAAPPVDVVICLDVSSSMDDLRHTCTDPTGTPNPRTTATPRLQAQPGHRIKTSPSPGSPFTAC